MNSIMALHLSFNHAPLPLLRTIIQSGLYPHLKHIIIPPKSFITCTGCIHGKAAQRPHRSSSNPLSLPGQYISSDTIGPIRPPSGRCHRHIVTFLDTHSRFIIAIPIKSRAELATIIPTTMQYIRSIHGKSPNRFHTDNAREYLSRTVTSYLTINGTEHTTISPHQPQSNSKSERINRTLLNAARSALAHSRLPNDYWDYAILDAVYKYNHIPHSTTNHAPTSLWNPQSKFPPLIYPFGTIGTIVDCNAAKTKLSSRSRPVRFLHNINHSHLKCLFLDTNRETNCRYDDFQPYHPAFDPSFLAGSAFKVFHHNPIPTKIQNTTPPPNSFNQMHKYPDAKLWYQAHDAEITQLNQNNVIEWIHDEKMPSNIKNLKPISLTMTYRYKPLPNNTITRKARCAIRGDMMKAKFHYNPDKVSAYTAEKSSSRLIFAHARYYKQQLHHFDISSAFTHEPYDPEHTVYVRQMPLSDGSFAHPNCKYGILKKNLYGSKPAGNIYLTALHSHMLLDNYKQSTADPCIYFKHIATGTIIVSITIDDFLVTAPTTVDIQNFHTHLASKYKVKHLGKPTSFLGWSIEYDSNGDIHIYQPHLISKVVNKMNMQNANPRSTPLPHKHNYDEQFQDTKLNDADKQLYISCIGDLRYLADCTRPDLAFATGKLARFITSPTQCHLALLKHTIRYLHGHRKIGLSFTAQSPTPLLCYSDSDYAESDDRKSTSAAIIQSHGTPIHWLSRKQQTIALSTTEAEYVAASQALQDLLWIRKLLSEINHADIVPTPMMIDNNSVICIASHTGKTRKRKHIDIKSHHLHHHLNQKSITMHHVPTSENIADLLTKPLLPVRHDQLVQALHALKSPLPPSNPIPHNAEHDGV